MEKEEEEKKFYIKVPQAVSCSADARNLGDKYVCGHNVVNQELKSNVADATVFTLKNNTLNLINGRDIYNVYINPTMNYIYSVGNMVMFWSFRTNGFWNFNESHLSIPISDWWMPCVAKFKKTLFAKVRKKKKLLANASAIHYNTALLYTCIHIYFFFFLWYNVQHTFFLDSIHRHRASFFFFSCTRFFHCFIFLFSFGGRRRTMRPKILVEIAHLFIRQI
jgi:hypothetical protein